MITHQQKTKILELVNDILTDQNNLLAEMETGHDWETYEENLKQSQEMLNQYLDGITT